MWAAAYREDPRTRHIYEIAVPSPTARHQLRDAKLSFDGGKFFHLSTMGKGVLVPRTLVTSIVAMYHESQFYGHLGVLCTMALIERDYVCSHLRHYVERYILSWDVCQAAITLCYQKDVLELCPRYFDVFLQVFVVENPNQSSK